MKRPLVFKYGGNAMTDENIQSAILKSICALRAKGEMVVLVHGGGPFIKKSLSRAGIESHFVNGQRVTSAEAISVIEKTLKGEVNARLVGMINALGEKAVGLSGKDGVVVRAVKRLAWSASGEQIDIGLVGNVEDVDTTLLRLLLNASYLPVMTCLADDDQGVTYNINGDVFAGHIAGALEAKEFVVLTDVEGLMRDINRPESLIREITTSEVHKLIKKGIIKGGMIPKLEACLTALDKGAEQVRIINGARPEPIKALIREETVGTIVRK